MPLQTSIDYICNIVIRRSAAMLSDVMPSIIRSVIRLISGKHARLGFHPPFRRDQLSVCPPPGGSTGPGYVFQL